MARAYYPTGEGEYTAWTPDMVGAAPSNHSHKTITDSGDGRQLSFNYSTDGMQSAQWCAVWNGNSLQSMHKDTLRTNISAAHQNIIMIQPSQPTDANCKIWIKI